MRQAFAQSINTVSARLGQEVGFRTVADMAQRFGITTPLKMSTVVPARIIGESGRGVLRVGNFADLILIDDRAELTATFIAGTPIFSTKDFVA